MVRSSASFASKRCLAPEPPPSQKVIDQQNGREDVYKIGVHVHLNKLFLAYCFKRNLDYMTVGFACNGTLLRPRMTPAQLLMEDYDLIHIVITEQAGDAS